MHNLKQFLAESKLRLQNILEQLNWTENTVISSDNTNFKKQLEPNQEEEKLFPPSCATNNSVYLADNEISELLKRTSTAAQSCSELQLNFSREEKVLLYEHVKGRIEGKIPSLDETADLISIADIMAMKKREKKNRRKHRVSKPTHTEELRSLVELQMLALEQHLSNQRYDEFVTENIKCENVKDNQKGCQSSQEKIENCYARTIIKSKDFKNNYNDELSERKYRKEKHYNKKMETDYKRNSKFFSRSHSKDSRRSGSRQRDRKHSQECGPSRSNKRSRYCSNVRLRSHSNERGRRYSLERRRSRSKDRYHHSKEKNYSLSKKKIKRLKYESAKKRSRSPDTSHRRSTISKTCSRSRSKHRRIPNHSTEIHKQKE